jgi:hypothetical protein
MSVARLGRLAVLIKGLLIERGQRRPKRRFASKTRARVTAIGSDLTGRLQGPPADVEHSPVTWPRGNGTNVSLGIILISTLFSG